MLGVDIPEKKILAIFFCRLITTGKISLSSVAKTVRYGKLLGKG